MTTPIETLKKKLEAAKKQRDAAERELDRCEARLETLMASLKHTFGVSSVDEARKLSVELSAQIDELYGEIENQLQKIEIAISGKV
jgi:archaellum component FlaC